MRDDAAIEFEGRVSGIVGGALVRLAGFVPALGDMRGAETGHGFHFAEEVIEHVAPVAEHIDDDAAAILLAVIPGWALGGDGVAFEDPVAELAADGKDLAEEALIAEGLQFQEAGEPELVLHDAVLDAGLTAAS